MTYMIVYTFLEARQWKQHRLRAEADIRAMPFEEKIKQQHLGLDSSDEKQL